MARPIHGRRFDQQTYLPICLRPQRYHGHPPSMHDEATGSEGTGSANSLVARRGGTQAQCDAPHVRWRHTMSCAPFRCAAALRSAAFLGARGGSCVRNCRRWCSPKQPTAVRRSLQIALVFPASSHRLGQNEHSHRCPQSLLSGCQGCQGTFHPVPSSHILSQLVLPSPALAKHLLRRVSVSCAAGNFSLCVCLSSVRPRAKPQTGLQVLGREPRASHTASLPFDPNNSHNSILT